MKRKTLYWIALISVPSLILTSIIGNKVFALEGESYKNCISESLGTFGDTKTSSLDLVDALNYIQSALHITLTIDQARQILSEKTDGLTFLRWIHLFIEADRVYRKFQRGNHIEGLEEALNNSSYFDVLRDISDLTKVGIKIISAAATKPDMSVIIDFLKFIKIFLHLERRGVEEQIELYLLARDLYPEIDHDYICKGETSDLILFDSRGWILRVADTLAFATCANCPFEGKPEDVFRKGRDIWRAKKSQALYFIQKDRILKALKRRTLRTQPSPKASIALVVDRSSSMGSSGYMRPAKRAASIFL